MAGLRRNMAMPARQRQDYFRARHNMLRLLAFLSDLRISLAPGGTPAFRQKGARW